MIRVLLQRTGLIVLVAALIAPAALAQTPQQQPQQAPEVEASSQEIDKVAELILEIEEVQIKYQTKMRKADDSDNARALQQEMSSEIDQTVEGFEGLSAERYDKITRAARADNELKQRILSRLKEKREEKEEG